MTQITVVVGLANGVHFDYANSPTNQAFLPKPTPSPIVEPAKRAVLRTPATPSRGGCSLAQIKHGESRGNYQAKNGQYTGAYQQSSNSWKKYGDGSAPTAGQASPASQDAAAARQYAAEGSRPWSVCH